MLQNVAVSIDKVRNMQMNRGPV